MAEALLAVIAEIVVSHTVDSIWRPYRYLFYHNKIINNLRREVMDLKDMRNDMQQQVDEAVDNLEVIAYDVRAWLTEVHRIMEEYERILESKAIIDKGCLNVGCPNLKSRYLLSWRATVMTNNVDELKHRGSFLTVYLKPEPPMRTGASTSTDASKGFPSRMATMKAIMNALKDDRISTIGICGMGGVGKTTMVKEVAERAMSENMFNEIAMAVMPRDKDLKMIQGQLADMLGLKLATMESIGERARRLYARLTHREILVILDDVSEAMEIREIGIPFGDDCKGCKVVLTTRSEQVCHEMSTQKIFRVEVLSEEEAWDLFKDTVGNCVDTADLRHIAREIVKNCGGLPLAIKIIAMELKDRKKPAWFDALQRIRKSTVTNISEMHKSVYSRLETSYEAKSLFLLCCRFPKDEMISIEMLVRYAVGLQFFKDVETLQETRKKVHSLVDKLTVDSLLVVESDEFVKVNHDVRNIGLSIASKEGDVYENEMHAVRDDTELKDWPQNDKYDFYTTKSLYSNEMHQLPANLDCAELKLLWLVCSHDGLQISRDFFEGMKALKVIDFRVKFVEPLPPSLQFLMNLRTLCLDTCSLRVDISLIGGLQKLEILSFFRCDLDVVPSEIGKLTNLKLLDLRCSKGPNRIPSGLFSCLKKLEELYMGKYFGHAAVNGRNQRNCASIRELKSLFSLKVLQILVPPEIVFPQNFKKFHFENLEGFDFSMFEVESLPFPRFPLPNSVSLSGVDLSVVLKTNINVLVNKANGLALRELVDFKNPIKELGEKVFVNVKRLQMSNCHEVEHVIDVVDSVPGNVFSNLESLDIKNMDKLTDICSGDLPARCFEALQEVTLMELPRMSHLWRDPVQPTSLSKLTSFDISYCSGMKILFPQSVVKCLLQLQRLVVSDCDRMEGVVSEEGGNKKEAKENIEFPKLNLLKLRNLPKFRSFYAITERQDHFIGSSEYNDDGGTIQPVFNNHQVLLRNMETLNVDGLCNLRQIVGDQIQVGSLHKLKDMYVSDCASLEVVFDFERLKIEGECPEVLLGQLKSMKLLDLPKLTQIWRMVPKGIQCFHNLVSLNVYKCVSLRYLLSSSMAKMVVNLQDIQLFGCKMMKEVILTDEDSSEIEMMDKIVFCQLRILELEDLENFTMFCYGKHDFELPLLERVFIRNCPNMKAFCSGMLTSPKLDRVCVKRHNRDHNLDESVWEGDLNNTIASLKR